ncbi:MAG: glycerate kinase [Flavobacteriaceae bacterium]|nr:glycerate kinase [Flavobacteriaceae bacterium]
MNIVVAPDAFKECLSAKKAAENISVAIKKIFPDAHISEIPISDGGEGLLEALIIPTGGKFITAIVKDPLLRNIEASYGILNDGMTAVIEMAKASGLELLQESEMNPLRTSTFGTGQLIKDALDRGCTKMIIGLGGSATNDGGMGMIRALGGKFLDKNNKAIGEGGDALRLLHRIDISNLDKRLATCEIVGACDVTNPLTGIEGASLVFGSQKGGTAKELLDLDKNLAHYTRIIQSYLNIDVAYTPGAGAAGGVGFAIAAFFKAPLQSGISLILDYLNLEKHIKNADLVITGEGKIDSQTLYGKTIIGLSKIARKHNVPVIVIAGTVENNIEKIYTLGVTAVFSIVTQPMKLEESIKKAPVLIQNCVTNIMKLLKI